MAAQNPQLLVFSRATYVGASGATAAATYSFFTEDYHPPQQERYIDTDTVKNQNGLFKYVYDNGPGWRKWDPFKIHCEDAFQPMLGATAGAQFANLKSLWEHPGILGMTAPEATYQVIWGDSLERNFRVFPQMVGDKQEFVVVISIEEAG